MPEPTDARRERYDRARSEFDHLRIEDKAVFLIEATVSTMARALEEAGTAFASEVDSWFRPRRPEAAHAAPDAPPTSQPPTSDAARKANATKRAAKKTVGKKKTTRKRTTKKKPDDDATV